MNKIRSLGVKKNDIIRVKFKNLNSLIKDSKMPFSDLDDLVRLSNNMRAYYNGGDFVACEDFDAKNSHDFLGDAIHASNHLDHDYDFHIYDYCIESIEIVNDARRFVCTEMDLIVVRVDDELYINGKPLIGDEFDNQKEFKRFNKNSDKEYVNKNFALLKIFEEFIADIAMRDSLKK
jgi:hypothetical protein